jgi:polysaccharide biosynthesis protein PslH
VTASRPRLLFVSPVFLFPADTGGRIRTTNIMRGLKGGAFDITLVSPASAAQHRTWSERIDALCDRFVAWPPATERPRWSRARHLLAGLPVNVMADRYRAAMRAVSELLRTDRFDIAVFDFVHCAVLRPDTLTIPSVCFTHNVEAEIFERHAEKARNVIMRAVWRSQARKMRRFEGAALSQFDAIVAVSQRDADALRERYGVRPPCVIPTGVDLDYFAWQPQDPRHQTEPRVVFTGSMDWAANIDGIGHFIEHIWPRIRSRIPAARFVVVGRHPPADLVAAGRAAGGVEFTGLVEDVRPHVYGADVFVIPLRVGGGTRIKAFEAMAMGRPVVSTAVGIEGLDVRASEHYLLRDDPHEFADAVIELLGDPAQRSAIARQARRTVEERFGHRTAASVFERACLGALRTARVPAPVTAVKAAVGLGRPTC